MMDANRYHAKAIVHYHVTIILADLHLPIVVVYIAPLELNRTVIYRQVVIFLHFKVTLHRLVVHQPCLVDNRPVGLATTSRVGMIPLNGEIINQIWGIYIYSDMITCY